MATFIKRSGRVQVARFSLVFDSIEHRGSGYAFDCEPDGTLHPLTAVQQSSLNIARNTALYRCLGVQDNSYSYMEPGIIRCHGCEREVVLHEPLTNDCECGRAFNMCGQEVNPHYSRQDAAEDGIAWDETEL